MKRFASHLLILSPDIIYTKQVIEVENQLLVRIFPLEEELESVSWLSGVLFLSSQKMDINTIIKKLREAVGVRLPSFLSKYSSNVSIGDLIYVYLVSSVDLPTLSILPETQIEELYAY